METTPRPAKLVLIVEDDEAVCDFLCTLVEREGHKTRQAHDGRKGLALVGQERFDAIITDLMMPDMGGFEFLRELQAGESSHVPVIIVTAKRLDRVAEEQLRAEPNVVEFLTKPIQQARLMCALQRAFQRGS